MAAVIIVSPTARADELSRAVGLDELTGAAGAYLDGYLHVEDLTGNDFAQGAEAILEAQRPFFAGQTCELAPMSLLSLSEALELHPSTISRATRDKYLQCRQGTYPLRYFFSRAVGEQGLSRQAVKQRLLALVQNEDPRRPLSDQRLCELLAEDGIRVARRTVAKYRMELRLPSSSARRR